MPEDGIFRAILIVLVVSTVAGAVMMLAGFYVVHSEAVVDVGTGLALVSGLLYGFFRILGRREQARRNQQGSRPGDPAERD